MVKNEIIKIEKESNIIVKDGEDYEKNNMFNNVTSCYPV